MVKVQSGSFDFDPNRRSPQPAKSLAADPDLAAVFQGALDQAAQKLEKEQADKSEKPASGHFPPSTPS